MNKSNSRYVIIMGYLSSYDSLISALNNANHPDVIILGEKRAEEKFDLSALVNSMKFEVPTAPFVEADVPFYRRFYKTKKDSKFKK